MAKLSYKERARLRREEEILKTAARMIRDNGYVNLNMDDLAEEVGISKPTLYQHFDGKDDMVARAMLHSMERMEAFLDDQTTESFLSRLVELMRYMLEQHTDPDGFSMAIMRDGAHGLKHLTAPPPAMAERQQRLNKKINQLVDHARAGGEIRPDVPNVVIVGMMFSSLFILQGPQIMRDTSHPDDKVIEHTIEVFRRGVALQIDSVAAH